MEAVAMIARDDSSLRAVSRPVAPVFAMYAIRPINDIYHLVTRGGQDTLCGLKVSRIAYDRTGNRLQLVNELPVERTICKHCERIQHQESGE
jgi:hypothetical protein